ncbi:hypothetical protein G9A89_004904 [Geosiphon pyriformis]|nr:hypothetical protein G9A89_004904 [Geosiphon pyriformis]
MTPGFLAKAKILKRNHFRKDLIIYFRGTSFVFNRTTVSRNSVPTREQWKNMMYRMTYFDGAPDAQVEESYFTIFLSGVVALRNLITAASNNLKIYQRFNTITFTGHGLGGVFALFSALSFRHLLKDLKVHVFTYGQPPIGNLEFSRKIGSLIKLQKLESWRITHSDDFVPKLPGPTVQTPYEIWIDGDCDCSEMEQIVYLCEGPLILGVPTESSQCNAKTTTEGERAHFGPYFGHLMGKCPK